MLKTFFYELLTIRTLQIANVVRVYTGSKCLRIK